MIAAALGLSACVPHDKPAPYPFEGVWDCGDQRGVFTLTDQIYNPGAEEIEILEVSAEGEGHFLRMVDGHEVLLTVIPDGRLHWQALTPNDDFTCKPLR